MNEGSGGVVELGYSALTRRERLERIATAERDRRAGRVEVAIAALGEATEWPARAVLALAKLPEFEAEETRRILEAGLDAWRAEAGLASFEVPADEESADEEPLEHSLPDLDSPIDNDELDRAFAEAEAQTDEMHSANQVAARVLMDEPIGLAELGGDLLAPAAESSAALPVDAAIVEEPAASDSNHSRQIVLATLERWLQNLEASGARRAR
jgi:hypothetical protein